MSKKVKIFAIVVLAIALIIGAVVAFSGPSEESTATPITANNSLGSSAGMPMMPGSPMGTTSAGANNTEFSTLLSGIKSITIDMSIFSNPGYLALRDHPVILGTDSIGRANPFAPIGSDAAAGTAAPAPILVQTLQPGKITATTAEFGAQVTVTDGIPAMVTFEYGTSDAYGNLSVSQTLTKSGTVLVTATKLVPQTAYFVRALVVRGSTTTGNTMPFTTLTAVGPVR